ncbi:hypothetical protein [Cellulophaga baltica]|uniref:hypothetical protein n=1 Tax=Cellulophaga baltica TaxID=76594 RepID=UPI0004094C96|nr:hypothetical protein [Cellulophaga baltica]
MKKVLFTSGLLLIANLSFAFSTEKVNVEPQNTVEMEKDFSSSNEDKLQFSFREQQDCGGYANFAAASAESEGGHYYTAWFRAFGQCVEMQ